jgi:hypothetical protein
MTINVRAAILAEMMAIWVGVLLVQWDMDNRAGKTSDQHYVGDLLIKRGFKSGVWILVLAVILLAWAEIGRSALPAQVGFVITSSTLLYEGVKISGAFENLIASSNK